MIYGIERRIKILKDCESNTEALRLDDFEADLHAAFIDSFVECFITIKPKDTLKTKARISSTFLETLYRCFIYHNSDGVNLEVASVMAKEYLIKAMAERGSEYKEFLRSNNPLVEEVIEEEQVRRNCFVDCKLNNWTLSRLTPERYKILDQQTAMVEWEKLLKQEQESGYLALHGDSPLWPIIQSSRPVVEFWRDKEQWQEFKDYNKKEERA